MGPHAVGRHGRGAERHLCPGRARTLLGPTKRPERGANPCLSQNQLAKLSVACHSPGRIWSSSRRRPAFRVNDLILKSWVFLHLFTPRNASIHALCVRICCCFSFCSYRLILNSMCLNTLANLFHIIQISKQFNFTMRPCFRIFSCFEEQLQGRCCLHQGCCWPDDWSGCKG